MIKHLSKLTLFSILVFAMGCDVGPWDAPPGAQIAEVEDIRVAWFGCILDPTTGQPQNPSCEPSAPVQIPMTVQVIDPDTEIPLNNIRISFSSGYGEIYLLPQEVIEALAIPDSERWGTIADGEVWAELTGSWEGDYRPTYYETWTDNNGLATFWIWVNEMPTDATGNPKDTFVRADIGVYHTFIKLTSSQ